MLAVAAHVAWAQAPSIHQRPISASATITGSPKLRDGQFTLAGKAAICGVIPKEASLTGEAAFVIEVAGDTAGSMTSITFGSKQLVGAVTTATQFNLSVGMVTSNGGRPPQYVLNTGSPRQGNGGTATLTTVKGVSTLRVAGANDMKENIDLTVTCG
jgi:hypothetical protein